jgi:hypothetical protein
LSEWHKRVPWIPISIDWNRPVGQCVLRVEPVPAVEYQGNFVIVIGAAHEFVPERVFFRDPCTIGDVGQATWPSNLARLLAKTTVSTARLSNENEKDWLWLTMRCLNLAT